SVVALGDHRREERIEREGQPLAPDAGRERAPAGAAVLPADLDRGAERQLLLLCTTEHRHRRGKLEDRGHRCGYVATDRGPGPAAARGRWPPGGPELPGAGRGPRRRWARRARG